jgi:hypothetical protein
LDRHCKRHRAVKCNRVVWITDILELSLEIRQLRSYKWQVINRSFGGATGDYFKEGLVQYKQLDILESSADAPFWRDVFAKPQIPSSKRPRTFIPRLMATRVTASDDATKARGKPGKRSQEYRTENAKRQRTVIPQCASTWFEHSRRLCLPPIRTDGGDCAGDRVGKYVNRFARSCAARRRGADRPAAHKKGATRDIHTNEHQLRSQRASSQA